MNTKRISFKCTEEENNKIETMKAILNVNREKLFSKLINDHFKEIIASIAIKEGVIESSSLVKNKTVQLDKSSFADIGIFDDLCTSLNITDEQPSSIVLEVKSASAA